MGESLFVVTGASRGMGAAIAEQLLQPGHVLVCISRQHQPALAERAAERGVACEQWTLDLAEPGPAAQRLQQWIEGLDPARFSRAALINNAGVISRIGPVDEDDNVALSNALRVGLEAPLLLGAAFIRATRGWSADRRILNVSSGLGRRAMAGSASYCAAKAGLDNLSRAMALDEAQRPNGTRIVSFAPGVIDTDMQTQLRNGDPAGFPDRGNFVNLKEGGHLMSPEVAAERLLAYLNRPDFGQNPLADVREA